MTQHVRLSFFQAWLAHPWKIGGIQPSSQRLAAAMVAAVPIRTANVVVELGAGTGAITRAILDALGPDGRLISFETNPAFVACLNAELRDPRVQIIPHSAATVRTVLDTLGVPIADCILSGVPLQALPPPVTHDILAGVRASMGRHSHFAAFQYTARQEAILRQHFPVVHCVRRVWWNLPPARIYSCQVTAHGPALSVT